MRSLELALQDLVDALETADGDAAFLSAADRVAHRLRFRWFAYLGFAEPRLKVLSSYPRPWARHYLDRGYERIDPVIREARSSRRAFYWEGQSARTATTAQRRLFLEAAQFGIRTGVTVPIRGGFGRFATFTFASDEQSPDFQRYAFEAIDALQLIGLYYHAHVYAKLQLGLLRAEEAPLTQRERQCLTWTAKGKTMADTAQILGIGKRTVLFHLENARAKLHATTLPQAVAEAIRRGLIGS
jgi:LuxR family transcriptional regulator, activator of conjugal transfer of Ti plasmids